MRVPPGSLLVFDQVLATNPSTPTAIAYSNPKFNDWLGKPNDLQLFLVADKVNGDTDGDVGVIVQETSDEEIAWTEYSNGVPSPNVSGPLQRSTTTILTGASSDASRDSRPSLAFRRLQVAFAIDDGYGSARIRIWATGRNGYRKFHRLIMRERVEGTNTIYTSQEACAWLAGPEDLAIGILFEEISSLTPNWEGLLAESPNGRIWSEYPSGPTAIESGKLLAGFMGNQSVPFSGFRRLGVKLSGTNPAATVRIWATGRDIRSG